LSRVFDAHQGASRVSPPTTFTKITLRRGFLLAPGITSARGVMVMDAGFQGGGFGRGFPQRQFRYSFRIEMMFQPIRNRRPLVPLGRHGHADQL